MPSAEVNYVSRANPAPYVYYIDPPPGVPASTLELDPRTVQIRGIRGAESSFDLERDGCQFLAQPFSMVDPDDPDAVRASLYPQAEALARELVGVEHIVAFDHGVRRKSHGVDADTGVRRGGVQRNIANFAHNDYIAHSAALRVRWFLGDAAESLLSRRFAIFNCWWPLVGPLYDHPLALCAGGVSADDFIPINNIFEKGPNPIAGFTHSPDHRWIYLSGMRADEMMMFRTWDSARTMAQTVPHAAFADPAAPPDAPPRESFELRVLAFYGA